MAKIKVHILNFHGINSHTEIVLENTSETPSSYYNMNRWARPAEYWCKSGIGMMNIDQASSVYSFELEADPKAIVKDWNKYWWDTSNSASILGDNCAVATQWFLSKYAKIPEPNMSNVSLNHMIFGVFWPSIIPCPVTLPGRVMSNAQFYLEARKHPETANNYSRLLYATCMAAAALAVAASIFAIVVASSALTGGLAGLAITGCVVAAVASTGGFFNSYNKLSSSIVAGRAKKSEDEMPIVDEHNSSESMVPA